MKCAHVNRPKRTEPDSVVSCAQLSVLAVLAAYREQANKAEPPPSLLGQPFQSWVASRPITSVYMGGALAS